MHCAVLSEKPDRKSTTSTARGFVCFKSLASILVFIYLLYLAAVVGSNEVQIL